MPSGDSERLGAINIEALRGAGDVGRDLLDVEWNSAPLGRLSRGPEACRRWHGLSSVRGSRRPAERSAVRQGRAFTVDTLREWSLPERLIEDATLMVSELLTNAIVHGSAPICLRLREMPDELAIEVDDGSSAMPRKLQAGIDDLHGRGLAIVAALGTRWAARPDGYGKTVWSTVPIPPS
jgi:anti-sigma regulatory factor (Ser/Thr protein kinase)